MEDATSRISGAQTQPTADSLDEGDRDHLTGALSRAGFEQHLRQLVSRTREYGEPFSLIAIDLDHFKSVNDAFGHLRGDQLLRHMAERARGAIREGDLFFRYGGDEFMVLLPGGDRREAVRVAERLLARVQNIPFSGEPPLTLTLSIGVASFPDDAASAQELLECVDARAYTSKRRGRGRITSTDFKAGDALFFDPGARPLEREAQLDTVQAFFAELPRVRRGALRVGGPGGAGHTRMLREVAQLAALQGYGVLAVQGALPLKTRLYGALTDAALAGKPLPPTALVNLEGYLADRLPAGSAGLFITVDDLAQVDRASLTALAELLEAEAFPNVAVAYSVAASDQVRFQEAPLQKRCELAPLSAAAVPLWLRHVLQWEAPADFVDWFYAQTGGLPAHLQEGLMALVERELVSQSGAGWHLAPAIAELDLASLLAARRSYPAHALPSWKGPFVGRSEELRRLAVLFDEERLVTLTGPGGSGKSRLAAQFGLERLARKRESVFFVPLAGLDDSELIAGAILAAMEIPVAGSARLSAQLLNALSQRPALLILDNFEHLLGGAVLVADMLTNTPAQVLVTSREPLRLPDEAPYLLRGLDLPPDAETPSFDGYGAVQLFVNRARQTDATFEIHERDRPHLLRICQLSEGVPLALELAAAWTKVLSCATIAGELEKSLGFLQETPGERGRLWGILDYFWRLLAPPEQRTVSYLATFRGGFSAEAARTVADASPFLLLGLVDRALLSTDETGRYQLHELLRQYAWQHLDEPARREAEERHARYFAGLAEWCEKQPIKRKNDVAYSVIDAELDNFRAAWSWAVNHKWAELLEPMTRALRGYFDIRGQLREARALFEQAAGALEGLPEAASARGWALEAQALFSYHLDRYDASQRLADEALALLGPLGPSEGLAMTLNTLGMLASGREDYAAAGHYFERFKAVQETLGDAVGAARALNNLATANDLAGNKRQAKRDYLACIELHRRHQNDTSLAIALINLAHVCNDLGEPDEAERALREGLAVSEQVGYRLASISALCALADTAHRRGDLGEAEARLVEAIRRAEQAGNLRFRRNAYRKLAELALEQGDPAQAGAHLGHAFQLIKRQSPSKEPVDEYLLLAAWLAAQNAPLGAAEILGYLQRFEALEANPKAAELKDALAATLLEAAFAAALKRGQDRDAATLLGEAETLLAAQDVSEQPA